MAPVAPIAAPQPLLKLRTSDSSLIKPASRTSTVDAASAASINLPYPFSPHASTSTTDISTPRSTRSSSAPRPPISKAAARASTAAALATRSASSTNRRANPTGAAVASTPPIGPSPKAQQEQQEQQGQQEQQAPPHARSSSRSSSHRASPSTTSWNGFLGLAVAALGGITDPRIRHRQSVRGPSVSASEQSSAGSGPQSSPDKSPRLGSRRLHSLSTSLSNLNLNLNLNNSPSGGEGENTWLSSTSDLAHNNPPSRPYNETDPNQPPPTVLPLVEKMHQTSSRLLRMTDDDRPFTKDFNDLFATLVVSLLPLSSHRVGFKKYDHTFLSEDAINNLGSLKFSQSNRMPDPKDPSRIVTTTTTTTFSMAKDMARSICQRFLDARLIEAADGKNQQLYTMKGHVWRLTPKGVSILDRFCSRNGIQQKQVTELVNANFSQMVVLERDGQTDKIVTDVGTLEVIFKRVVGMNGMNIKASVSAADADSTADYRDGITGIKMASERKLGGKLYKNTFTGKAVTDWLMDCASVVARSETLEMAALFVEQGFISRLQDDRSLPANQYQPTKTAIYQLTDKGEALVLNGPRGRTSESEGGSGGGQNNNNNNNGGGMAGISRDSNTQRLDKILNDAALRLLFRENLRETHCEENLSFYVDVDEFLRQCRQATRNAHKAQNGAFLDGIKEIMAQAYGIYNAFLAPGSPCELNIDHQLRNSLATRMTKAVGQDITMLDTLKEVMSLFEDAQNAVFKLMASDSVPKFLRNPKYEPQLKNHNLDADTNMGGAGRGGPARSQSVKRG